MIRDKNQLVPTFTGMAVTNLLAKNFDRLVDTDFTAQMEERTGRDRRRDRGAGPVPRAVLQRPEGLEKRIEQGVETIDPREISTMRHAKWGDYEVRVGRYGPYTAATDGSTASIPPETAPADLTEADTPGADRRERRRAPARHPPDGRDAGAAQVGPVRPVRPARRRRGERSPSATSLPKGTEPGDVDLDLAVQLLDLPRTLGDHPETGKPIKANIGRYGPYVQHERTFASLKPADGDNVLTVELERARSS